MLFGEHRIWRSHTRWIHSDLYLVLSPKHRCLKLKKPNHLSSCSSHTGHLTRSFLLYKKVLELSMDRSSNNRGLQNLSLPILHPLQAPTHKPSQEAQTPQGWGNKITPGSPPSSSSNAWKSWSNTSECQKPCSLLWQTGQREKKQVSEHESSFQ